MASSVIFARLRRGVPSEARRPAFDAVSIPAYVALAAVAVATVAALILLGFTVDLTPLGYSIWAAWLWIGGVLVKRVGHHKLGTAVEAIGFLFVADVFFLYLIPALTALALPDADPLLIKADAALRFDWRTVAGALEPHQRALTYLVAVYRSIVWQPIVVISLLAATNRTARIWSFALGWIVTLSIISAIYPLIPAQGPMTFYHIAQERFPGLLSDGPWGFSPIIHQIRDLGVRHITQQMLTGLVSFPSFHVAAAVLLAWAAWPIRFAGSVFLLLNLVMAAASIICGPHYLVDVLSGLAVAVVAIGLVAPIHVSGRHA